VEEFGSAELAVRRTPMRLAHHATTYLAWLYSGPKRSVRLTVPGCPVSYSRILAIAVPHRNLLEANVPSAARRAAPRL
ncbi:MAG: hypothetical protein ACREMF_00330, partial [Gemmatimonadales bacterium]